METLRKHRGALILFGLAAVFIGATLLKPAGVYDEGLIVSGAERILHGQRPYVDFNSGYPPGQFYTIALLYRVFGANLVVERIWDSLWRLAIIAAAYWLARELAGKNVRLLPLACCAALAGGVGYHLYPMVTATLPCLCAVACALVFQRTRNFQWIFAAGLFLGCTAVYRHDLAGCAAIVVLASVWRDRRAVLLLAAGTLLIAGPVLLYLISTIPHSVLWKSFVEFPRVNAAARHLPLTLAPISLVRNLLLPVAIVAFAAVEARRTPIGRRKPLILVTAVTALMSILATQRLDSLHAFPSLVFCVVLLACFTTSSRPQRLLIILALFFYGAVPIHEWSEDLQLIWRSPAAGVARAGPVRLVPGQAKAVQYIEAHLPPGEPLYVGVTSHSRVSFNDALFSFLAERPQATRFDMWIPGETNRAPAQAEIVRALETKAVRYVVLVEAPTFYEPNLSSVDTGVKIVDDYLASRYRQVAAFGHYRILLRTA